MSPRGCLISIVVVACCGPAAPPRDPGVSQVRTIHLDETYMLAQLAVPIGDGPPPPELAAVRTIYDAAYDHYLTGVYARSADEFVQAAALLTIAKDHPFGDVAASDRSRLYQDAAYAWLMAGTRDLGIATHDRLEYDGVATDDDLASARATLRERR